MPADQAPGLGLTASRAEGPPDCLTRSGVPTTRAALLAALGAAVLAGTLGSPGARSIVLALDVVLVLACVLDYLAAKRSRIEVRRLPHGKLNLGAPNSIIIRVRNFDGTPVRVRLKDAYPDDFAAPDAQGELEVAANREGTHRYSVTPPRRGRFQFGDVAVRVEGPWGLAWAEWAAPATEDAHVYPDLRGAARLLLATTARDLQSLGLRRFRRDGSGSEFARLREYVQGDPPHDIDWKATARRRAPVTRVYESERSQSVVLCVDAGRAMAAQVEGENGALLSKLDCAVNAALFLAFVAIRNGDRVGLALFSDGVKQFLAPAAGRGQYRRIVRALYGAEPTLSFVDYAALFRELSIHVRRRSMVVLFTDLFDEGQAAALTGPIQRMARRHVPLCVALRDPALERIASERPRRPDDLYSQAVAQEVLEERERLCALIGRQGVQFLDTVPSALTIDTVNRYLEIKRRRLL